MSVLKIQKRNGKIVNFDKELITTAIKKASEACAEDTNKALSIITISDITDRICSEINDQYDGIEKIPTVEKIQDLVERFLVEFGYFEIAKRYILYRAEHARSRADIRLEELQKIEQNLLKIKKSNGSSQIFDITKIQKSIHRAAKGLTAIDEMAIAEEVKRNIFDNISTADISKTLVMSAKSFIERDPEYSLLASRLLLESIYREVFQEKFSNGKFLDTYQKSFIKNLKKGVAANRINKELLTFDLDRITDAFDLERDRNLNYLGLQTLYDRYFTHINNQRIEAPQHFWMRVAMGLALAEKPSEREKYAIEFYHNLSSLTFVSSTPTLFNAGTTHSQLSSCYLSTIDDSLKHIFKVISDNAQLSKWAGGIGNDWTRVRATGSKIEGTNGASQGVIPFLKIANDTAVAVNQGGKRKGAVCAYLECWHFDFLEFLELRKNTGDERRRTHDMNIAAWIPDLFMQRLLEGGDWTLFSPDEVPELHDLYGKEFNKKYEHYEAQAKEGKIYLSKTLPAADLWRKMVTMLFETGHPWMTFKDPCNIRSPQDHCGVIHDSNLCTEITLNNSNDETAVCNLGSINLAEHFDSSIQDINREKLSKTIKVAMRMLDNVIDINFYPTPETKNSNMKHRPVGIGLMGLADIFYLKNLNFDSEAAIDFTDEIMEEISYHAILSSAELASERGAYESFEGSKWSRDLLPIDTVHLLGENRNQECFMDDDKRKDWTPVREAIKKFGMRNSNTMAIAPTATISNIAGCVPCTEPIYKNLYVKSNMGGEFTIINKYLVDDLKSEGLWNAEMYQKIKLHDGSIQQIEKIPIKFKLKYKEVFEIESQWIIKHASKRQKWLDQAQSTNIFYKGTSGKAIADTYIDAWKYGLKTTYYLRTLAASQVEKSTISAQGTHKRDFTEKSTPKEDAIAELPIQEEKTPEPVKPLSQASIASLLNNSDCEACQ